MSEEPAEAGPVEENGQPQPEAHQGRSQTHAISQHKRS